MVELCVFVVIDVVAYNRDLLTNQHKYLIVNS